jgi:dipeptidyl-peptidase-4
VVFLRSAAGDDPRHCIWVLDVEEGRERIVVDAAALDAGPVPEAELARRERVREAASGVVDYAVDRDARTAFFAYGGDVWVAPLDPGAGAPRCLDVRPGPVFDPRPDPSGRWVAWCAAGALWAAEVATGGTVCLADGGGRQWGVAEHVAAEEMGRANGYWWAPDGSGVLAAAVDESAVRTVWIADPSRPERPPLRRHYPLAGTDDADVSLWYCPTGGTRHEIPWDRGTFPYLVSVTWPAAGGPLLLVERRDHRAAAVLSADVAAGSTAVVEDRHDDAWVAWPHGTPDRLADGRLLWSSDAGGTRRLTAGGEPVTPEGLQVRAVHAVGDGGVLFSASSDPTSIGAWRWAPDGSIDRLTDGGVVVAAAAGGGTTVLAERRLGRPDQRTVVASGDRTLELASRAEAPSVRPQVRVAAVGPRELRAGLLLPSGHRRGDRLPVLLRPYGGPGAQQVMASDAIWLEDQWWADQGFAVVVIDGRGTPGRGPEWERAVHRDLAGPVLDDQVDGLHAIAAAEGDLDLGRVGIMGWSFGGYLAALAVLRRPDVFHAAVAGAPVTDWRLYDTYYTERHLGHPGEDPGAYDRCCLLPDAPGLARPLLLVHGLADDNVLVAHTVRLSQALVGAGRPHRVLPLSGITHMASEEDVAESLLLIQLDFLREALAV